MKGGLLWYRYEPTSQLYQLQPDAGLTYKLIAAVLFINAGSTVGGILKMEYAPINSAFKIALLTLTTVTANAQLVQSFGPNVSPTSVYTQEYNYPIEMHSEDQLIIDPTSLKSGDSFGFYVSIIAEA